MKSFLDVKIEFYRLTASMEMDISRENLNHLEKIASPYQVVILARYDTRFDFTLRGHLYATPFR